MWMLSVGQGERCGADKDCGDGRGCGRFQEADAVLGATGDEHHGHARGMASQAACEADERNRWNHTSGSRGAHHRSGAIHQVTRCGFIDFERTAYLASGVPIECAMDQRGAFGVRQSGERGEGLVRACLFVGFVGRRAVSRQRVGKLTGRSPLVAQDSEHRPVSDRKQPWAERTDLDPLAQGPPCVQEGVLYSVLSGPLADHPRAVAQQRHAVALHDDRERRLVSCLAQLDETLVSGRVKGGPAGGRGRGAAWAHLSASGANLRRSVVGERHGVRHCIGELLVRVPSGTNPVV